MTAIMGVRSNSVKDKVAIHLAASSAHPRFLADMFDPLWRMARIYGIDQLYFVAQSYKETGGGKFTGNVPTTYFNTCGLKVRDTSLVTFPNGSEVPLAHCQSASWFEGAEKQAQHLYAYMGKELPLGRYLCDPRWLWVYGKHTATQWEDLTGKWAVPGIGYGESIVEIGNRFVA